MNRQTLFSFHLLDTKNKGDKKQDGSQDELDVGPVAYRSAKNLSVTTLKLPAQVYRTDRLAVHHPVHEESAHELQELHPWELELVAHCPQESSSGYAGSYSGSK